MKTRFIVLVLLLFVARGCDFYTTSLWIFQENGLASETNPLTRLFGVGWNGLVVANVIICTGVIALAYFYYFRYQRTYGFKQRPTNVREFVSLLYYGRPDVFHRVFYYSPLRNKAMLAHAGYVVIRVLIVFSFIAAFHNACQFYSLDFYDRWREIIGRPLYFIYGLVILTIGAFYYRVFRLEYRKYKRGMALG